MAYPLRYDRHFSRLMAALPATGGRLREAEEAPAYETELDHDEARKADATLASAPDSAVN